MNALNSSGTKSCGIKAGRQDAPTRRRIATRKRICEAANTLFFDRGFNAATMEEIAKISDIRRSTLYLHFRDKDEILSAIAEEYTEKLQPVIARLPRPAPTYEQITKWIQEFAEFVSGEQAATELLVSLSHLPNAPDSAKEFGESLKQMMAERLAAFRDAMEPGNTMAYARAVAAMDGLGWALCHHARSGGDDISKARLMVAAEQLNNFVQEVT